MTDAPRILDANLNRAREALRVMEDIARFSLADAALAADLKLSRQSVRTIAEAPGMDAAITLASRDTPGDVGTSHTSSAERSRAGIRDIAIAAGKRAGEALRTIEECCKLLPDGATPSAAAKALRYRVYDLEKRLVLALGTGRAVQWSLCVLMTESLCAGRPWEEIAAAALRAGTPCLQLREKDLPDRELLRRASRLVAMCREHSAAGIINDRPDIALLARATGVHLGQDDLSVADVRRIAGNTLLIGVSTANMDQARAAARAGADYCGVGPMFATTTKHKPALSGPAYLRDYLADEQTARLPHLAIGGITPHNVSDLVAVGGAGVAASSVVCTAPDPEAVCRQLIAAFKPR
jgi:thiamine-phosphate pyrophosphorylase